MGLKKHFSGIHFDRKTPVKQKPVGKPGKRSPTSHGKTGKSLVREVRERLQLSLKRENPCDLILILDDLDCRDSGKMTQLMTRAVSGCLAELELPLCTGFAAPEIETWIISDWQNTFAAHPVFSGNREKAMQYQLSHAYGLDFTRPESFGTYDPQRDSCDQKLSACIAEASIRAASSGETPFSKARHTPEMLSMIDPDTVSAKCPLFRSWWKKLENYRLDYCLDANGKETIPSAPAGRPVCRKPATPTP